MSVGSVSLETFYVEDSRPIACAQMRFGEQEHGLFHFDLRVAPSSAANSVQDSRVVKVGTYSCLKKYILGFEVRQVQIIRRD